MGYLVLAYPQLSKEAFHLIQTYREKNDGLFYSIVDLHFTIVFTVFNHSKEKFIAEITERTNNIKKTGFIIKNATIIKDAFKDYYHIFLVPEQGYRNIIKIHDKLYSGLLADNLRSDLNFIPHIGIGNSKDKSVCNKMADDWNSSNYLIKGQISHLTIVDYSDNKITTLKEIELK